MAVLKGLLGSEAKSRNTFKQIHNTIEADTIRASRRLKMKKKQKVGEVSKSLKTLTRTVEFAQSPIDYGNPAQKVLFLTSLGLTPKEGILMPPYISLKKLKMDGKSSAKILKRTRPAKSPQGPRTVARTRSSSHILREGTFNGGKLVESERNGNNHFDIHNSGKFPPAAAPTSTSPTRTTLNGNGTYHYNGINQQGKRSSYPGKVVTTLDEVEMCPPRFAVDAPNGTHTPPTNTMEETPEDIDEDELELELLICPSDIPEVFDEFYKNKQKSRNKSTNCSNSQTKSTNDNSMAEGLPISPRPPVPRTPTASPPPDKMTQEDLLRSRHTSHHHSPPPPHTPINPRSPPALPQKGQSTEDCQERKSTKEDDDDVQFLCELPKPPSYFLSESSHPDWFLQQSLPPNQDEPQESLDWETQLPPYWEEQAGPHWLSSHLEQPTPNFQGFIRCPQMYAQILQPVTIVGQGQMTAIMDEEEMAARSAEPQAWESIMSAVLPGQAVLIADPYLNPGQEEPLALTWQDPLGQDTNGRSWEEEEPLEEPPSPWRGHLNPDEEDEQHFLVSEAIGAQEEVLSEEEEERDFTCEEIDAEEELIDIVTCEESAAEEEDSASTWGEVTAEDEIISDDEQNNSDDEQNSSGEEQNASDDEQNASDEEQNTFDEEQNTFHEEQNIFHEEQNTFDEEQNSDFEEDTIEEDDRRESEAETTEEEEDEQVLPWEGQNLENGEENVYIERNLVEQNSPDIDEQNDSDSGDEIVILDEEGESSPEGEEPEGPCGILMKALLRKPGGAEAPPTPRISCTCPSPAAATSSLTLSLPNPSVRRCQVRGEGHHFPGVGGEVSDHLMICPDYVVVDLTGFEQGPCA